MGARHQSLLTPKKIIKNPIFRPMPRRRQRISLEAGLKLDLNRLIRQGWVRRGVRSGLFLMRWTNSYWRVDRQCLPHLRHEVRP